MNPDVLDAIEMLERQRTLTPAQALRFSRVARRELVSVHSELRLAAYVGVLLVMAGVAVLVQQNLERIGPAAVAAGLTLGCVASLAWVMRLAPAFSWGESPSPHLAFDYVLLLGALLFAADLAWIEARFTPLGAAWPWHLAIVAVFHGALAFRFDSRVLLSLALTTCAAWRGVSASTLQQAAFGQPENLVRANAIGCGLLFVLGAIALRVSCRKAHFEPVATHVGWLLMLGGCASGVGENEIAGALWAMPLVGLAAVLGWIAWRERRFSLLAIAIVAAYVGLSALVMHVADLGDEGFVWWLAVTPLPVLGLLLLAHRRLREPA